VQEVVQELAQGFGVVVKVWCKIWCKVLQSPLDMMDLRYLLVIVPYALLYGYIIFLMPYAQHLLSYLFS
jgi:hypothetical protein